MPFKSHRCMPEVSERTCMYRILCSSVWSHMAAHSWKHLLCSSSFNVVYLHKPFFLILEFFKQSFLQPHDSWKTLGFYLWCAFFSLNVSVPWLLVLFSFKPFVVTVLFYGDVSTPVNVLHCSWEASLWQLYFFLNSLGDTFRVFASIGR